MRRIAATLIASGLLAAGCGAEEAAPTPPPQLAAWELPRDVFVPRVEPPPPIEAPEPERSDVSPGAPTDDEIRAELRELYGDEGDGELRRAVSLGGGLATAPPDAPRAVQEIVAAANHVARLPYVYGGGHGRGDGLFVDSAYDCSGSISFALANAGLIERPMTSGELMAWGEPGQGEWVTIYANESHAFMVVGGARFDTVGLRETGSRWQRPFRTVRGFTAVHPRSL